MEADPAGKQACQRVFPLCNRIVCSSVESYLSRAADLPVSSLDCYSFKINQSRDLRVAGFLLGSGHGLRPVEGGQDPHPPVVSIHRSTISNPKSTAAIHSHPGHAGPGPPGLPASVSAHPGGLSHGNATPSHQRSSLMPPVRPPLRPAPGNPALCRRRVRCGPSSRSAP